MKKVKYYCPYSNSYFHGVLVKEDDVFFYIADPLFYLFAESFSLLDEIKNLSYVSYLKDSDFYYQEIADFRTLYREDELDLFLDFCSARHTLPDCQHIALFFGHFFIQRNKPLHVRMENSIRHTEFAVSERVLGEIIIYLLNRFREDENRMRAFFSPLIQPYIKEKLP